MQQGATCNKPKKEQSLVLENALKEQQQQLPPNFLSKLLEEFTCEYDSRDIIAIEIAPTQEADPCMHCRNGSCQ